MHVVDLASPSAAFQTLRLLQAISIDVSVMRIRITQLSFVQSGIKYGTHPTSEGCATGDTEFTAPQRLQQLLEQSSIRLVGTVASYSSLKPCTLRRCGH